MIGLALLACAIWLSKLWLNDLRNKSSKVDGALPGATPCPPAAIWIACLGAVGLLAIEAFGEKVAGLDDKQTTIAWHFISSMIAAAVLEELVFRGYLVVTGRGNLVLITSAIVFSLLFALAHPYLWAFKINEGLTINLNSGKAWFTTSFLFIKSLWFYHVRFASWNPRQSLLPSVAAHMVANLATYAIKAKQGFITW
ncbi:MAG: CPBP family intramembrane metalloprotease [Opitutae bacterium]|nr:CPBP family intramembrane metalloprotease [Opitutae bacterium]